MMRNGGQILVESLVALGATKGFGVPGESFLAVLDLNISPEALTPRQTLTQMRDAALAAKEKA